MQTEVVNNPEIYFTYLSGKNPDTKSLELYREAIAVHEVKFNKKEARLHEISTRFPFLISLIDGGLALTDPFSAYRKNIYIILCILETRPEFFPLLSSSSDEKTGSSFLKTFFHGIRAAGNGVLGFILVKLI